MKNWIIAALAVGLALAIGAVALSQNTRTANVEVRVWRSVSDHTAIYWSARAAGGNWADLGTNRVEWEGVSASGRFEYDDIAVAVPISAPREPGSRPTAIPTAMPTATPTATPTGRGDSASAQGCTEWGDPSNPPGVFAGTVTDLSTGLPVRNGISVTALVGDHACATSVIGEGGVPDGRYVLRFRADEGALVRFLVGSETANETAHWTFGIVVTTNLTVGRTPASTSSSLTSAQWASIDDLVFSLNTEWTQATEEYSAIAEGWSWDLPQAQQDRLAVQNLEIREGVLDYVRHLASEHAASLNAREAIRPFMEAAYNYWDAGVESASIFLSYVRGSAEWDEYADAADEHRSRYNEYVQEECSLFQRMGYTNANEVCSPDRRVE